jgi:hypothetical protein
VEPVNQLTATVDSNAADRGARPQAVALLLVVGLDFVPTAMILSDRRRVVRNRELART